MLLNHLAQDDATPAVVLAHLTRSLHSATGPSARALACHLVTNPAVTHQDRMTILARPVRAQERAAVLRCALGRPGVSVTEALTLLGADRSVPALCAALDQVQDPTGELATYVGRHGTGPVIWGQLLRTPTAPAAVKVDAAVRLAAHPTAKPNSFTRAAICDVVRDQARAATTSEDLEAVLVLRDQLATATYDKLAQDVRALDVRRLHRPAVDSDAWLSDPRTSATDLIAWAHRHGASSRTWVYVLRRAADPTGALAERAFFDCGDTVSVLRALLTTGAPAWIQQKAATALDRRNAHTSTTRHRADALVGTGDPWYIQWVIRRGHLSPSVVASLTRRADMTPAMLDQLTGRYLSGVRIAGGPPGWQHLWGVMLATHPVSTTEQRAQGRELATAPVQGWVAQLGHLGPIVGAAGLVADATADLDPTDPRSVAAAGARLPLAAIRTPSIASMVGVRWLLGAALTALVTDDLAGEGLDVLARMGDDLPAQVTLADVFATAGAILS